MSSPAVCSFWLVLPPPSPSFPHLICCCCCLVLLCFLVGFFFFLSVYQEMEEILSAFPCLRQPRLVGQLALAQGICVCKNSRMFSCLLLGTFQSHSYLALWQCSYCQPVACSLSIGAVQLGHCLKGSCELRSTHLKWLLFLWAT